MAKRLTREEVPVEQTWNIGDIFPSLEEWEAALTALPEHTARVTKFKGQLDQGPQELLHCLDALEALQIRAARVMAYASLNQSGDGTNPQHTANASRAASMSAFMQAETSFVQSEALALPEGTLPSYLAAEPALAPYQYTLEKWIASKPHLLSPESEMVLAALSEVLDTPVNIYERSRTADMAFSPVTNSKGEPLPMAFARYDGDADLVLGRNAYHEFTKSLKSYHQTYGTAWGAEVKKNVVLGRLRRYDSAIHMLLDRQEVTADIYHNIHDVILAELAPHMRRYARLRKRVLGLDQMFYCDLEVPLDPTFSPSTTYGEAKELLLAALAVLGPEYSAIMESGLQNRWVDRADNIGKRTGAFCNSVYGVHPYISMSWTNRMRNALTLAHELGHAGQGVLAQRYQRLANTRPTMFFIEAPSTMNEILVADYILSQSKDTRMRRWVIMQLLMTYHHNFVRHLIEGELQRRTYALAEQGQPITANVLDEVQGAILEEFWGGEVQIDEGARRVWMRQAHYYRGLYPYSYAAGLTIGTAVAKAIREQGPEAAKTWVEVLKAGGTKKPLELGRMAGVDMQSPLPIREAVAYVGSLVDEVVTSFDQE
ncbi:MAG: oligoendopeptidase F [Peptococcaceae bacterium]|nr:oligoendopeptidase F [Peptococcaceae bacterium]